MSIMVGTKPVKAMKVGELAGELQRYINSCNGLDGQSLYPECANRVEEIARRLNEMGELLEKTKNWLDSQCINYKL